MKKIRLITPHTNFKKTKLEELASLADLPIAPSVVALEKGPASIESEYDEMLASPYVVARAIEAEKDGIDAIVIDCMGDPGLAPAREAVSIPVLGPGETSMHVAGMLGHKFSFITVLERIRPMIERRAKTYGVSEKLASVRAIDVPVMNIDQCGQEDLVRKLTAESIEAIVNDYAHAIILGCTGFLGIAEKLRENLLAEGFSVPVINPLQTTVMTAFSFASIGLTHSALTYPGPAEKGVKGYDLPRSSKLQSGK